MNISDRSMIGNDVKVLIIELWSGAGKIILYIRVATNENISWG